MFGSLSLVGLHLPPPLRGHCPCYPPGDFILGEGALSGLLSVAWLQSLENVYLLGFPVR